MYDFYRVNNKNKISSRPRQKWELYSWSVPSPDPNLLIYWWFLLLCSWLPWGVGCGPPKRLTSASVQDGWAYPKWRQTGSKQEASLPDSQNHDMINNTEETRSLLAVGQVPDRLSSCQSDHSNAAFFPFKCWAWFHLVWSLLMPGKLNTPPESRVSSLWMSVACRSPSVAPSSLLSFHQGQFILYQFIKASIADFMPLLFP